MIRGCSTIRPDRVPVSVLLVPRYVVADAVVGEVLDTVQRLYVVLPLLDRTKSLSSSVDSSTSIPIG